MATCSPGPSLLSSLRPRSERQQPGGERWRSILRAARVFSGSEIRIHPPRSHEGRQICPWLGRQGSCRCCRAILFAFETACRSHAVRFAVPHLATKLPRNEGYRDVCRDDRFRKSGQQPGACLQAKDNSLPANSRMTMAGDHVLDQRRAPEKAHDGNRYRQFCSHPP